MGVARNAHDWQRDSPLAECFGSKVTVKDGHPPVHLFPRKHVSLKQTLEFARRSRI
jgi:hypothetical protein